MTEYERTINTFVSPVAFYGYTDGYKVEIVTNCDKNGIPLINKDGHMSSTRMLVIHQIPCRFATREEPLQSLMETYNKVCSRNAKIKYRPFDECLLDILPECLRINSQMEGVKLVMKPLD